MTFHGGVTGPKRTEEAEMLGYSTEELRGLKAAREKLEGKVERQMLRRNPTASPSVNSRSSTSWPLADQTRRSVSNWRSAP